MQNKLSKRQLKEKREKERNRLREWRKSNPVKYAYQSLKDNAKRRGIDFTISLDQFMQFAEEFDYINKKGRSSISYGVDRIDETKGYVPGNLQVLRNGDNTRKARNMVLSYTDNPETGERDWYFRKPPRKTLFDDIGELLAPF